MLEDDAELQKKESRLVYGDGTLRDQPAFFLLLGLSLVLRR